MRAALAIIGLLMVAMGLLWVGQGLGYVHWPASSFMIDQRPWAVRGGVLALAGFAVLALAQRRRI